jgi:hypothetical protein
VSLAVQAAEASIDAWELRAAVKSERQITRALEADCSTLAAPSRIEALACQTLSMARPAQVAYLQLPPASEMSGDGQVSPDAGPAAHAPAEQGGARGLLATLMDLAAGEAQVLLVGDVGLGLPQ